MTPTISTLDGLKVGDAASCDFVATEDRIRACADLSLDTNPLHMDAEAAREYGFPRPVAHGLLALSLISRLIGTQLPGAGALWLSQEVKFVAPVLLGDPVTARVVVDRISKATGIVALRTEAWHTITRQPFLTGMAKVRVLSRAESS